MIRTNMILHMAVLLCLALPNAAIGVGKWPEIGKKIDKVVLTGINIVDADSDTVILNCTVFLGNGLIERIELGNQADLKGYEVVDMTGKFLMPGLIDMHSHILDRADLAQYLSYGTTTVRNMMGLRMHLRWKRRLNKNRLTGSRLITAGPTLNSGDHRGPFHKNLKDTSAIPKLVKRIKSKGYDFLKIYDGITPDQFLAIERAASNNDMYFAGHPPKEVDRATLLASEIRSFEHIEEVYNTYMLRKKDDSLLQVISNEFASNQMALTMTLSAYHHLYLATAQGKEMWNVEPKQAISPLARFIGKRQTSYLTEAEPDLKARVKAKDEYLGKMTRAFYEAGVPLLLGTDTGPNLTVPGLTLHDEIDLWAENGIPANEILKAGTSRASEYLGMGNEIGLVKEGYRAELLILDENPLENLRTLRNPTALFYNGRLYSEDEIIELRQLAYRKKVAWIRTMGNFLEDMIF